LAYFFTLSGWMGFTNQMFCDSWVVGFWRADHGRHCVDLGRRTARLAYAVFGSPGT
jgi:hypothetical protein